MKGKKYKNEKDVNAKQQDSSLITKESVSAVCCLFSSLALLILCTDALIFGVIGQIISDFLLGVFGYLAFPIFLGASYLSVMNFIEKRLIKNRFAFSAITVAFVCLLLLAQTAITYTWEIEGYAKACFAAGEGYQTATLVGWCGALLISIFVSFLSKIGAMILFALVAIGAIYLSACSLSGKKIFASNSAKKETKQKKIKKSKQRPSVDPEPLAPVTEHENSMPTPPANTYPPMQREGFANSGYSYATQRPSFTINGQGDQSNKNADLQNPQGAYSPFGGFEQNKYRNQEAPSAPITPSSPENYKEFLFGGSSVETFRRNLIFDSNANVNRRSGNDYTPINNNGQAENSGFSSYTNSYEESLGKDARPQKIIEDNISTERRETTSPFAFEQSRSFDPSFAKTENRSEDFASERETNRGIERGFDRNSSDLEDSVRQQPSFSLDSGREFSESTTEIAEPTEPTTENRYSRHEYMDMFTMDNPNIFGRREDTPRVEIEEPKEFLRDNGSESTERDAAFDRIESVESDAPQRGVESIRERTDTLNIFDENYKTELDDEQVEIAESNDSTRTFMGFNTTSRERDIDSVRFNEERIEESKAEITQPAPKIEPPKPQPTRPRIYRPYSPAPLHYFNCSDVEPDADEDEVEWTKGEILQVYEDFGVTGVSIASVTFGPTITRYNIVAPRSVSPSKLVSKDIETAMAMSLRVESGVNIYPNFKDGVISIEVPNKNRQTVHLGCMLTGPDYINAKPTSLVFSMGKNVANQKIYGDICKMTHLLVAGSSGSGKSVFLGTLIVSLINHYSPQQLRLILIDPKKTEFVIYRDLPHLMINDIINEPKKAVQSLGWAIGEMNRRYELFEKMSLSGSHVVNIDEYNAKLKEGEEKLPKIVIVVDELADLMLAAKKDVEERIQNLTQKSRAAGIHLIIATQRPSADVITGVIKANLATRIAFMVATDVDSRVILDASGAQKLLGYGDMMYITAGQKEPIRLQSAFISSDDTQKVVEHIKSHNDAYFDEEATNIINNVRSGAPVGDENSDGNEAVEEIFIEALKVIITMQTASISMIQRKCGVGFNKAGKIVDWMETMEYISPFEGPTKQRKVLITKEEFEEKYGPM